MALGDFLGGAAQGFQAEQQINNQANYQQQTLPLSYCILLYLVNLCYGRDIKLQHIYHHNFYSRVHKCILKTFIAS